MTPRRARSRAAAAALGALLVAACSSASDAGPAATFATTPPADETTQTSDAATATATATVTATDTDAATEEAASEATTTTAFVPDDDLDVPTAAPGAATTTTPPTTLPAGPLPVPEVVLVDVGTFDAPVEVTTRPGDPRTFVVEQGGRVLAIDDISSDVVLDITGLTEASGEQGLLGLAFHPERDLAYVDYIDDDGDTMLVEFAIDPVSAVFDLASFREVFTVEQPFGNHNGGELAFGPDGHLYVGLGDGGSGGDPQRNSLDVSSPLGKILRIDPLEAGSEPFTVPADNPFVDLDGADARIWSVGLRNPWRFSFDAATGDLWIGDVGQNEFEEISFAPASGGVGAGRGVSFGWSAFEGDSRFNTDVDESGHTSPRLTYAHADGHCSVSGGAVYRGEAFADLAGWYVYGDFCSGTIWGLDTTSAIDAPVVVELTQLGNLAAIAVGADDDLFAVSTAGTVARLAPA